MSRVEDRSGAPDARLDPPDVHAPHVDLSPGGASPAGRRRVAVRVAVTVMAGVLVWAALSMPASLAGEGLLPFLRLPLGVLVIVLVALLVPPRALRIVAIALGVVIGLLVLLKALDIGFTAALDRPFDLVGDWSYLGSGAGVLADMTGRFWAVAAVVGAVVATCTILVALPWAMTRITGTLARQRRHTAVALAALTLVWAVGAWSGIGWGAGGSVASANTGALVWRTANQVHTEIADREAFAAQIATDRFASVPPEHLLAGLRGKDVLLVFVESYGRVALDDPQLRPTVHRALTEATGDLRGAGFSARSGFLVSPTFGGASWLAHSTVESGVWVDGERRYQQLVHAQRLTLVRAFGDAGWRTVFDVPATTEPWPEGKPFYGFQALYTAEDVGYQGPRYGYATMPDQYTLQVFRDRELSPAHRKPVMAEIDLLSSHVPWTPPPPILPWGTLGDGSVFATPSGQPLAAPGAASDQRVVYAQTIAYTMRTLASFAASSDDPNLVIIAMGDHQPNSSVTRPGASHQVPAMVIAHDPAVIDRIADWGWTPGLEPAADAPVWPMSALRDRLFTAFSGTLTARGQP